VGAHGDVLVLGGDDARDAQRGDGGIEEGGLDADDEVGVDSLGIRDAGARVDVDDFADGVRVDEVAGDDEVVGMPLKRFAVSCRPLKCVSCAVVTHRGLTMSSGSSGSSETCSSSSSFGMRRDTSFMVSVMAKSSQSAKCVAREVDLRPTDGMRQFI
jgi:hypothetical protein